MTRINHYASGLLKQSTGISAWHLHSEKWVRLVFDDKVFFFLRCAGWSLRLAYVILYGLLSSVLFKSEICIRCTLNSMQSCYFESSGSISISTYEPRHDKTNKVSVRPAKTQISLGICPVWSESSLCAQWVAKGPSFLRTDSEDSDQIGRMPRLIWVFAERTLILLVLSCLGSYSHWARLWGWRGGFTRVLSFSQKCAFSRIVLFRLLYINNWTLKQGKQCGPRSDTAECSI